MIIGEQIKKYRKIAGLSQKELGEKLGVSQQHIAQYENGKRIPKFETIKKIADSLNVHSLVLLGQISKDLSDEILEECEEEKYSNIYISLFKEIFNGIDIKKEEDYYYYVLGKGENSITISELTFDNTIESVENFIHLYVNIANNNSDSQECFFLINTIKDMDLEQIEKIKEYAEFLKSKKKTFPQT